jgi:hypothetical protein
MVATAAVAAGTFLKVFLGRNAPQFKRLIDELVNAFLHFLRFLLRVDESLGDRIFKERVAFGLKCGDLTVIQRQALMLLLVE